MNGAWSAPRGARVIDMDQVNGAGEPIGWIAMVGRADNGRWT